VHRLLDSYFAAQGDGGGGGKKGKKRAHMAQMENVIPFEQLQEIGKHISFTERRADDAERELRQVKILELLKDRVGEQFVGVVTGITNFGIFVQISEYLIDGLIRYEDLMDDWWDVDERSGQVRGQRTGTKIGIGDVVRVTVVNVDVPRRELNLAVAELMGRAGRPAQQQPQQKSKHAMKKEKHRQNRHPQQAARGGGGKRGGGGGGNHFARRGRRR
jgi:ribonuclease R